MDQIFVSIQDSFLHKGGTIKSHAAISRTSRNREITFVKNGIIVYVRNIFATIRLLLFSTNINENEVCTKNFDQIFKNINMNSLPLDPRDFEILGWCPAGAFLPHGEKVPL